MPEHWICSVGKAGGCTDAPVNVAQTFHVATIEKHSFNHYTPRYLIQDNKSASIETLGWQVERLGNPKCECCGGPALWQAGEERPVRRVPDLEGELLHQGNPADLFIQFLGAYLPDELADVFLLAGWVHQDGWNKDLRIEDQYVGEFTLTDTLVLPLQRDHERKPLPRVECAKEVEAMFAICQAWGIPLAGPRQRTLSESM